MKLSYNWLRELVEFSESPDEICHLLTFLGFESKLVSSAGTWKNVITARVTEVRKHPNADKLNICSVSDGTHAYSVVCGAPNVAENQVVPLALIGAELPNGMEIKRAKIRGVESEGMLCSEKELGLTDESSGIMVLPYYTAIGLPLDEIITGSDSIIEVEVATNRPDCLSHLGIAREIAAKLNKPVKYPEIKYREIPSSGLRLSVKDAELCPRYIGCLISGVKIGPSPEWLARRLESCGLRPINNVVDITNYVLLELGHPLHAFDKQKLDGGEIVVRHAAAGEKIPALDSKEYSLRDSMLVIADRQRPQAIAGIIGGEPSGVTEKTETIILESAVFKPGNIRRTARSLGIMTDSSYRFERGTTWEMAEMASWRAVTLIEQITGGTLVARDDVRKDSCSVIEITVRPERVRHLLNIDLPESDIENTLRALGVKIEKSGEGHYLARIPSWRLDIKQEVDLIEELARIKGYEHIPVTILPVFPDINAGRTEKPVEDLLRERLLGQGFFQAVNYSFSEEKSLDYLRLKPSYRVANPLSRENEVLRPSLLPGLLKNLVLNAGQGNIDIKLFESGTVFTENGEHSSLALIASGLMWPEWWGWEIRKTAAPMVDFYFLGGIITNIFSGIPAKIVANTDCSPFFHPGKTARLELNGVSIGEYGILRPEYGQDLSSEIGYAEINVDALAENWTRGIPQYEPSGQFPPVKRDISILAEKNLPFEKIAVILSDAIAAGSLLQEFEMFSRYQDEKIGYDKVSYSLHLIFRHASHTLTDNEVNKEMEKILLRLKKELTVTLR